MCVHAPPVPTSTTLDIEWQPDAAPVVYSYVVGYWNMHWNTADSAYKHLQTSVIRVANVTGTHTNMNTTQ